MCEERESRSHPGVGVVSVGEEETGGTGGVGGTIYDHGDRDGTTGVTWCDRSSLGGLLFLVLDRGGTGGAFQRDPGWGRREGFLDSEGVAPRVTSICHLLTRVLSTDVGSPTSLHLRPPRPSS